LEQSVQDVIRPCFRTTHSDTILSLGTLKKSSIGNEQKIAKENFIFIYLLLLLLLFLWMMFFGPTLLG